MQSRAVVVGIIALLAVVLHVSAQSFDFSGGNVHQEPPKLTPETHSHLRCIVCQGAIKDIEKHFDDFKKKVSKKGSYAYSLSSAINDALEARCPFTPFQKYSKLFDYSDLMDECRRFVERHEEMLEEVLFEKKGNSIVDEVCLKRTKVCKDVDLSKYADLAKDEL